MMPQILTGIQLNLEGEARARALGLYAAVLAGGAVVGQILGGLIVEANLFGTHWRPIFLINVPIAAVVLAVGPRWLPEDPRDEAPPHLDLGGIVTLSAALIAIVLPLTVGHQSHWPTWTWIVLGASAPLLGVFFLVERRVTRHGGAPLLNLHVLRRSSVFWALWPQPLLVSTYYALLFTFALYMQQGLGHSPLVSGLTLLPWVVAFGASGRILPGHVPERLTRFVAPAGCGVLALADVVLSISMVADAHPEALLLVAFAIGGFGLGMCFNAILPRLMKAATPRYAPDISGVFTTTLQVAGAIGVAAFGTLYLTLIHAHGSAAASHAFGLVTAAFAITGVTAGAIAYRATTRTPEEPVQKTREIRRAT